MGKKDKKQVEDVQLPTEEAVPGTYVDGEYWSAIQLGEKYTDAQTGISGYAEHIAFHRTGCTFVGIETMPTGLLADKRVNHGFDEQRLVPEPTEVYGYPSAIILGDKYRDKDHGIEGIAVVISCWRYADNRVDLQMWDAEKKELITVMVDEGQLIHVPTEKALEPTSTGPATTMRRSR